MIEDVLKEIKLRKDPLRARLLSRYFKTGKGQYAEGDIFWGLTVPMSRQIAHKYKDLPIAEIQILLKSKIHEQRLIALLILMYQYKNGSQEEKEKIVKFYLKNTKYINNWDLVDLPCCHILGEYLWEKKDKKILIKLANSKNLWEQRIAMVSTLVFIKNGDMRWTIKLAKKFLNHEHDLMHKATGWALREMGKRNPSELHKFLQENVSKMPRTMLRYAIEKFPRDVRIAYLKK
jgi:3-methyladenine DNA glycosylase AlkD